MASIRRRPPWLLLGAALALGCALEVQTIRYPEAEGLAARPADCEVRVRDWYRTPDADCRDVGDVYVGNPGFSLFRCGEQRAEQAIRSEACRLGADTALVRRIKDFHAACYQARARLLRCETDAGARIP